jgi:hypothetical protein
MLIATIPCAFALVGLLIYVLSSKPETKELGRITFFCGLFVALYMLGHKGEVKVLP